ncbi:MAG: lipase [Erysipelotrichaceae bacterium]|nr:lipase [Erysipelotrichaceae bacterium]
MSSFVSIWGNAMSIVDHKPEGYSKDMTLRYSILIPFNTAKARISLDNYTGKEPVTFNSVTAGIAVSKRDCKDIVPITFKGNKEITLQPGESIQSDPFEINLTKGQEMMVSIYFKDFTSMRCGVTTLGPDSKAYFSFGDQTYSEVLPPKTSKKTFWFYFLNQVDIEAEATSIICYGDSITAQDWPENLHHEIMDANLPYGVIRRAVSGTRILREYDNITYESYGLKATNRFPHESTAANVKIMIIQQGINDIIHPVGVEVNEFRPWSDLPTAEEIIEGLRYYIQESKKLGYIVLLGTLLPIEGWRTYEPFRDELRVKVNNWMRTTNEADGCIDFDKATCDPEHPARFLPEMDSGDHLHPSKKGYKAMGHAAFEVIKNL